MHRRTVFLFTALVGLVLLVAGFAALSVPSFTLSSFAYAGSTASALKHDTLASHADGVKGVVASAGNDQDVDFGAYGDVSGGLSSDHSSRPVVSIENITPELGEEGNILRVTLKLSRPLTADEKFCYTGSVAEGSKDEVCIEGGIIVWDTYDDHRLDPTTSTTMVKFVFRGTETEKRVQVSIPDDECVTPGRTIRIAVNGHFRADEYGYTIEPTDQHNHDDYDAGKHTIRINGNDMTNGTLVADGGTCAPVEDGATEEADINRAPLFGGLPRVFSIPENTGSGRPIGDPVTATDPDEGDTPRYWLNGTDSSSFSINSSTGQISTRDPLDHETKETYHVAVKVRDGKDIDGNSAPSEEDDSIDVTINVTDVNERPSFDAGIPTSLSVAENTVAGTDIGDQMTATDPDVGDTLTYSLDTGDGAAFEIDASGQIKTKDDLDRETKSSYSVTVSVTDGKDDQGNADTSADDTHRVTITVGDRNEAPTFADDAVTTLEVDENTSPGQNIGAAYTATDDDGDSLTYSLDDNDGAAFTITGSGQIRTKDPLNHEGQDSYSVTVSVHDGKDDQGNADTTVDDTRTVTITVRDLNERPVFDSGLPTTLNVVENTATGTNVGDPFRATDEDEGETLTYSLDDGDGAAFTIDGTGQIKTNAELDNETKGSYRVTVSVTDGRDDTGATDDTTDITHTVTITVGDANERPSFADAVTTLQVAENTPAGRNVGAAFTATDPDRDSLTYSLDIGDGAAFSITSNGQIRTKEPLDHEAQSSYSVTVSVHDGKDERGNADSTADDTIQVTINVTDVEEVPEFDGGRTVNREVAENTPQGQPVGDPVAATDGDNDPLTYSLTGTHADKFDIVTGTGQILTKAALDHEARGGSVFHVTVEVYDGIDSSGVTETTPAVDDTIGVRITVTDVNEKPAFDEPDPARRTIAENMPAGQRIEGPVSATDPDRDANLTYSLDSASADVFEIVSTTGQLKTKGALNHETQDIYYVDVSVTDGKNDTGVAEDPAVTDATIEVIIDVRDVNEPPEWDVKPPENQLDINENTEAGVPIGQAFLAVDPDVGDTVKYWLVGNSASHFEIDENGYVLTKGELNHEGDATYAFRVRAGDGRNDAGQVETTTQHDLDLVVTVTVNDVNEKPWFLPHPFTLTVDENTPAERDIGDPFTATDEDGDTITYSLTGTDAESFEIDTSTGQLKTKAALDFEGGKTYSVTIDITDSKDDNGAAEDPAVTDTQVDITIDVINENEAPEFDGSSTTRSVDENTAAEESVGDAVEATDEDTDAVLTYSLSGADADSFGIEEASGQILVKEELDFETKSSYSVTVSVSDRLDSTGTSDMVVDATISVTITVNNLNEDGVVTLSTQDPRVGAPVIAELADDDGTPTGVTWQWARSTDGRNTWTPITDATAETYTPVPGDVSNHLRATASYTDAVHTGIEQDAEAVTDRVVQENIDPEFAAESDHRSVAENTPAGRNVGTPVTATDADESIGDVLTYSLGGTDAAAFDIVAESGQILTKAALDFETKNSYEVEVIATDTAEGTATIAITINVTNIDESGNTGGNGGNGGGNGGSNGGGNGGGNNEGSETPEPEGTQENAELTVEFDSTSHNVDEGQTVTITVNVSPDADRGFEVPVSFSGSAESGDYSVTGLTDEKLVFEEGDTSASFTITTVDDSDRDDETITIQFGEFPESVSGGTQTTVQISVDDTTPAQRSNNQQRSGSSYSGGGTVKFSTQQGNNAPEFTEGSNGQRSVSENTESGMNIGNPVSATDADGDTLLYTLGGPDASSFSIDIGTGQLRTSAGLDYEEKVTYYVIMDVYDGKGGKDTIVVRIDINDVADQVQTQVVVAIPTPEPVLVPDPTQAPIAIATPTPTPTPAPAPTPRPTATPRPTPTVQTLLWQWPTNAQGQGSQSAPDSPTPESTPTREPAPTAEYVVDSYTPKVELSQGLDFEVVPQPQPLVPAIPIDSRSLRIWPIVLIIIGAIMEVVSIGMFVRGRTEAWIG